MKLPYHKGLSPSLVLSTHKVSIQKTKNKIEHSLDTTMMATYCPEKISANRESILKELVQGQEFATQLQILLHKPYADSGFVSSPDELVAKVLKSFTQALSLLTSRELTETCHNLATSQVESICCDDQRSEDSGESTKRPTANETRGSYKRRRTSQSCTLVSATTEDGHAWRKYGQKEILNAKYPRCYFRCTHKYGQGCKATKQVQRMEEDPHLYRTTYIGSHTCRDIIEAPQIITTPPHSDPYLESYNYMQQIGSNIPLNNISSSCALPTSSTIKQEYKEEMQSSDITDHHDNNLDSVMWMDVMAFESADQPDYKAVTSTTQCGETSQSFDMDFVVKSINFGSDFDFDFDFDDSEF